MDERSESSRDALRREGRLMGDVTRGLYHKFNIERTDGKSAPGEKHYDCDYFVLDLTHDEFAIAALAAYSVACKKKYPLLYKDLREKLRVLRAKRNIGKQLRKRKTR